jgi:hypothetical protein
MDNFDACELGLLHSAVCHRINQIRTNKHLAEAYARLADKLVEEIQTKCAPALNGLRQEAAARRNP